MDACKTETLGPAALRKNTEESPRPPLSLSEKNNAAAPVERKPRTREVTSRYKSGLAPISIPPSSTHAATQRCPSPTARRVGVSQTPSLPKRSLSADRRRPATPTSRTAAPSSPSKAAPPSPSSRPSTPVRDVTADLQTSSRRLINSGRTPDGLWPAMRSLSTSFQSESSVSNGLTKREKPVPSSTATADSKLTSSENMTIDYKRTPSRGKSASDQSENSRSAENSSPKVLDQHRWPGIMSGKLSAKSMSRSMDLTERANRAGGLSVSARGVSPTRKAYISDVPSRGLQKTTKEVTRRMSFDGSGRLEHEISTISNISADPSERTLSRLSGTMPLSLPGSPHPSSPGKASLTSAFSSRSTASPSRTRPSTPSSPSKLSMSSASFSRGAASPSRSRPSTPVAQVYTAGRTGISSSAFSCILDVRKGRKNTNRLEDPHQLRLLYNQHLQWRFVNARADAAMSIQKTTIEKILYCVWGATSKMRASVTMKRIKVQQLRQEMKLASVLKHQMTQLEDWASLDREHLSSLLGAIEALKASTIRLPVIRGATADIHSLKDSISSAVDVMQAMGSSICHLISMVESTSSLVSELAEVAVKENDMLTECRELLASTAATQVQESSLRTHLLQLRQDTVGPEGPTPTTSL